MSGALCLSCQHGTEEIQSRDWSLVLGFICGLTRNPVGRFKYIKQFVMDEHVQMHQQEKGLPILVRTVVDCICKWCVHLLRCKNKHTLQNNLVNIFPVECLLDINIQTSQNVCISQYVFWPMFIQEKFILVFQRLNTVFLMKECACKLYMLLHTNNY